MAAPERRPTGTPRPRPPPQRPALCPARSRFGVGTTTAYRYIAEVPVVAPGEVVTDEVLDYLRSGVEHGVLIPDADDPSVKTLRVVVRD